MNTNTLHMQWSKVTWWQYDWTITLGWHVSVHVYMQCLVSELHTNSHCCNLSGSRRGCSLSLACEAPLLGGQFIIFLLRFWPRHLFYGSYLCSESFGKKQSEHFISHLVFYRYLWRLIRYGPSLSKDVYNIFALHRLSLSVIHQYLAGSTWASIFCSMSSYKLSSHSKWPLILWVDLYMYT